MRKQPENRSGIWKANSVADSCVRGLNPAQRGLTAARTRKRALLFGGRFLGRTGQKKTLEEFPTDCCAGSAYCNWLKNEHEKTLQALICKVFLWSIGESNPCSATNMVATPHCGARFLFVEKAACEISSTGGRRRLSLSNASHCLRSGTRLLHVRITKQDHHEGDPVFVVEHRGVEPLTSTMRMSRATNCANAPYRCLLFGTDGSITQDFGKDKSFAKKVRPCAVWMGMIK